LETWSLSHDSHVRKEENIMVLLDNDGFLNQLTHLLQRTRTSGSVNITMKRYHGQTKPKPKPRGTKKLQKLTAVEHEGESKCLFRATNGKKKLSTVVRGKIFDLLLNFVLKANMDNLKKRDRKTEKSKAKKSKATQ
ncbi:unnamed protein product, partial [Porites evermanni]